MDVTKFTPIEYNGRLVAPTMYLANYIGKNQDRENVKTTINYYARKMNIGVDVFALKDLEFKNFKKCYNEIFLPTLRYGINLFTKSGVAKLTQYPRLKKLKDFAVEYFAAEKALPIIETSQVKSEIPYGVVPVKPSTKLGEYKKLIDDVEYLAGDIKDLFDVSEEVAAELAIEVAQKVTKRDLTSLKNLFAQVNFDE